MSISDVFNTSPTRSLSHADLQWNKMWDLWAQGEAPSPYRELMSYQGEVNNGGHDQYFSNTEDNADLPGEVQTLLRILPEPHAGNLSRAYEAYLEGDEIPECDGVFYENEESLNDLFRAYADTIVL